MSPRSAACGLQCPQSDHRARCTGVGLAVPRTQQPVDGSPIRLRIRAGIHRDIKSRRRVHSSVGDTLGVGQHFVAYRLEDHHHRITAPTRCRQQGNDQGMRQPDRLRDHRHDVIPHRHRETAAPQVGVMLHQALRCLDRVGHQHRFRCCPLAAWQAPQGLEQCLKLFSILSQPLHETDFGSAADLKHARYRINRRQTIAHGMRHTSQQIVVNDQPARDARRFSGVPASLCIAHC